MLVSNTRVPSIGGAFPLLGLKNSGFVTKGVTLALPVRCSRSLLDEQAPVLEEGLAKGGVDRKLLVKTGFIWTYVIITACLLF